MKAKSAEIVALEKLLGQFVDQVERGVHPANAGWVDKIEPNSAVDALVVKGVCENKGDKIRVAFSPLPKELESALDFQNKWLADVHAEMIVAVDIAEHVLKACENISSHPALVYLGWTRMLVTSGFPVITDRTLRGGFSIDSWFSTATKATPELSFSVVEKLWKREDVNNCLRSFGGSHLAPDSESAAKVKQVLKWDKVVDILEKVNVLALGLLWFVDKSITDLIYPESLMFVEKGAWSVVEKMLEKNGSEIMENIANAVERIGQETGELDAGGRHLEIANWGSIIRIPW